MLGSFDGYEVVIECLSHGHWCFELSNIMGCNIMIDSEGGN